MWTDLTGLAHSDRLSSVRLLAADRGRILCRPGNQNRWTGSTESSTAIEEAKERIGVFEDVQSSLRRLATGIRDPEVDSVRPRRNRQRISGKRQRPFNRHRSWTRRGCQCPSRRAFPSPLDFGLSPCRELQNLLGACGRRSSCVDVTSRSPCRVKGSSAGGANMGRDWWEVFRSDPWLAISEAVPLGAVSVPDRCVLLSYCRLFYHSS
jgi:hypothetical protein